jgi:DNA (cytosine-5)-methyltransferase 1
MWQSGVGGSFDSDGTGTLVKNQTPAVAFQSSQSGMREVEQHATLDSHNGSRRHNGVRQGMAVRRLTPRECERLQGLPDDYTLVPYRGKPAKDGPRYKAIGNGWAVPCVRWIGERIDAVGQILRTEAAHEDR